MGRKILEDVADKFDIRYAYFNKLAIETIKVS
jgi:hypothetical protein